jgi:hypothetical protein
MPDLASSFFSCNHTRTGCSAIRCLQLRINLLCTQHLLGIRFAPVEITSYKGIVMHTKKRNPVVHVPSELKPLPKATTQHEAEKKVEELPSVESVSIPGKPLLEVVKLRDTYQEHQLNILDRSSKELSMSSTHRQ